MSNQQPAQRQLIFPNRENVIAQQLQNVLGVIGMTSSALYNATVTPGSDDFKDKPSFPPREAKIALENVLVSACDRAQKILDDDQRWDLANQVKLEEQFQELREANLKTLQAAQRADNKRYELAAELQTPHAKYRPKLGKTTDGKYVAFLGTTEAPEFLGVGNTPEEAMQAFDAAFITNQKTNESNQLDREGNRNPEQPANHEEQPGANRASDGPEPGLGDGGNHSPEAPSGGIAGLFWRVFGKKV